MTAQTILTISVIATITVFAFCFTVDLAATLLQAWRDAAPQPELQPESELVLLPDYASLDWVKLEEVQDATEGLNIIELAKARLPKSQQPTIVTLPQTPEAEQLEEWLAVASSPVSKLALATPRPDYTRMTVKKLRQEAKIRNVRNASAMAKKDLIAALLAA